MTTDHHHQENTTMPDPTPTPCPEVLRLLPDRDPVPCRGPAGHPGLHYHEHPGIPPERLVVLGPPRALLPRALDVDDDAVGRLAAALELGRLDGDDGPTLLEVVAEALAASYGSTTFATAGRLIEELENAGYRIRPIAELGR